MGYSPLYSGVYSPLYDGSAVGSDPTDLSQREIAAGRYNLYIAERQDVQMPVLQDYASRDIRLVVETESQVEDLLVEDLHVYEEADLTKAATTLTFNLQPITESKGKLLWSIRDVSTNQNLENGQFDVRYAPTVTL